MKVFEGFKKRQYQLHCGREEKSHVSFKSVLVRDLFDIKVAYHPMFGDETSRYHMKAQR